MMKRRALTLALTLALPVALALGAGGCSILNDHDEVNALNQIQPVGSAFTQRITEEYRILVNRENDSFFDQADALHFARKGLASARGDVIMPEPIGDWNLLPHHMAELGHARGRLIHVFDGGAREILPGPAALAQASFDCWIEQQEENWEDGDVNGCKQTFFDAIERIEIELNLQTSQTPPPPEPVNDIFGVDPSQPMVAGNAMYLAFFDFDKYNITSGARGVLVSLVEEIKGRSIARLHIVGHADRAGPNAYNKRLGMKRAGAVRDALQDLGVDPKLISVESRGEEEPMVPTEDNVREPANRRAEMTFE